MPATTSARLDPRPLVLGVDLTSAGARPGAHRARGGFAARPFDGERFVRLVRTADRGLLDLITLDEGFLLHPGRGRLTGRLDAAVAAARVAPLTTSIGFAAAVDALHLDAVQVAAAVAGADRASAGRAAWHVGLAADLTDERAAAHARSAAVNVARQWDHDTGDDSATDPEGRLRVDQDGIRFAVRRTPAAHAPLPQGRPPVVVRVRDRADASLAAAVADVVRIVARDLNAGLRLRGVLDEALAAAGRDPREVRVLAEVFIVLAGERESAEARLAMVEALDGPGVGDGAIVVAGTPAELGGVLARWAAAGAADGFLLRPAALEADLGAVVHGLVPDLQQRGLFRVERDGERPTLRSVLGLPGGGPAVLAPRVPELATV